MIEIQEQKAFRQVEKLLKEFDVRTQAFLRQFMRELAQGALEQVKRTAPREIPGYAEALVLKEWMTQEGWIAGIVLDTSKIRLSESDLVDTVVYVQPLPQRSPGVNPADIVAKQNPWTMDTIPYYPTPEQGSVMVRRVTKREVQQVAAQRKRDVPQVVKQLKDAGVALKPAPRPEFPVEVDLAFEILRYEYGEGAPSMPHWRPAISSAEAAMAEKTLQKLAPWVQDPRSMKWKSETRLPEMTPQDVKAAQGFQGRVI